MMRRFRGGGILGFAALFLGLWLSTATAESPAVVDWSLDTAGGGRVRFSEALERGPVLVSFWALWCSPCLKELPHVDALARDFDGQATVWAVNTDTQRSRNKVRPYLRAKNLSVTVPLDTAGELSRKLQVGNAIPFTVLYDTDGREVYRHTGYREGDEKELRAHLEALLASDSVSDPTADE